MLYILFAYICQAKSATFEQMVKYMASDDRVSSEEFWSEFDKSKAAFLMFQYDDTKAVMENKLSSASNRNRDLTFWKINLCALLINALDRIRSYSCEKHELIFFYHLSLIRELIEKVKKSYILLYGSENIALSISNGLEDFEKLKENIKKPKNHDKLLSTIEYRYTFEVKSIASVIKPFDVFTTFGPKSVYSKNFLISASKEISEIAGFLRKNKRYFKEYVLSKEATLEDYK